MIVFSNILPLEGRFGPVEMKTSAFRFSSKSSQLLNLEQSSYTFSTSEVSKPLPNMYFK